MKEKPVLHFQSRHDSGNIFFLLYKVRGILQKQRRISEWNDLAMAVKDAKSYVEALALLRKKVNLIDDDGEV